ncbi:MAG: hypothetical protein H0U92_09115 [Actinobacteria bacterium]|nr:hypothetical protein [Actinomycetota bacterium]
MTATTEHNSSTIRRAYRRVFTVGVGAVFVGAALGVGVAYATTRPDTSLAPGTARLVPGDAAVTVHRVSPTAAADAPLRSGDVLTVTRGIAIVQTAAGRLFARPGTTIAFDGTSPRIRRGDVLINATKPFELVTQTAEITVRGVARVHQALSLEVGQYKGSSAVETKAQSFTVPALRRAVIAGLTGSTLGSTTPLSLNPTDSWDRRLMGVALELDAALSSRSRGLTLQVANATVEVRDQVLSAVHQWTDLTVLAPELPVGESIVAAELARAGQLSHAALRDVLALRAEGASWGLVAVAHGIKTIPAEIPSINATVVPIVSNLAPPLIDPNTVILPPQPYKVPVKPVTPAAPPTTQKEVVTPPTAPVQDSAPVVADPLGPVVKGVSSILSGLLG